MKKIYLSLFMLAFAGAFTMSKAQCVGGRYFNYIFPANPILTSNIAYGSNVKSNGATESLELDVYEPNGDSLTPARPLVLIAHGGSFVGGSKTGTDVVPICKDLAKLGYVAVAIEYRLGMTNFPIPGPDSSDATEAVMRGVQDGRAAVRYFRKNAAIGGNTYRIDTNNIYFAGVSAGGFIALQLAYLDKASEIPSFIDMTGQPGLTGGLEGNSGNPGYSSEVKAIINICGALGDTAWMKPGDEPVLSFHGTNDGTVPYGSSIINLLGFYPLLKVHGSYSVSAQANKLGLLSCFEIYEGQDHVPATSNAAYYDTTITMTKDFLYHFVCGAPLTCVNNAQAASSIKESTLETLDWSIFPNPANNNLMVDLRNFEAQKLSITIFNALGKNVLNLNNMQAKQQNIDISNLSSGLYQVMVYDGVNKFSKKLVKN
jgi:para-nitrobenzyl esterase